MGLGVCWKSDLEKTPFLLATSLESKWHPMGADPFDFFEDNAKLGDTDTGDIILFRLSKGVSYGTGDKKPFWNTVPWGCWNQTKCIEKWLKERYKALHFVAGQRHAPHWHLLIFYILIDQISIILILFSTEIIVSTLHSEPRKELIEQETGREGCIFYLAPIVCHSICCSLAGPHKTSALQKQERLWAHTSSCSSACPSCFKEDRWWVAGSPPRLRDKSAMHRWVRDSIWSPGTWAIHLNPWRKLGLSSYL